MKRSVTHNSAEGPLCLLNGQRKFRVEGTYWEILLFHMFLSTFLQENNLSHLLSHADGCIIDWCVICKYPPVHLNFSLQTMPFDWILLLSNHVWQCFRMLSLLDQIQSLLIQIWSSGLANTEIRIIKLAAVHNIFLILLGGFIFCYQKKKTKLVRCLLLLPYLLMTCHPFSLPIVPVVLAMKEHFVGTGLYLWTVHYGRPHPLLGAADRGQKKKQREGTVAQVILSKSFNAASCF